jgi:hypothetical protein
MDSVTTSDRVMMKMVRGDLQFSMDSKLWWGLGMLHFLKVSRKISTQI